MQRSHGTTEATQPWGWEEPQVANLKQNPTGTLALPAHFFQSFKRIFYNSIFAAVLHPIGNRVSMSPWLLGWFLFSYSHFGEESTQGIESRHGRQISSLRFPSFTGSPCHRRTDGLQKAGDVFVLFIPKDKAVYSGVCEMRNHGWNRQEKVRIKSMGPCLCTN